MYYFSVRYIKTRNDDINYLSGLLSTCKPQEANTVVGHRSLVYRQLVDHDSVHSKDKSSDDSYQHLTTRLKSSKYRTIWMHDRHCMVYNVLDLHVFLIWNKDKSYLGTYNKFSNLQSNIYSYITIKLSIIKHKYKKGLI